MTTNTITPTPGAPVPTATRRPLSGRVSASALTTLTWLVTLVFFFPVFWMVVTSFHPESEAATRPPTLVGTFTLEQYQNVVDKIAPFAINSITVSLISTFVVIALALPAAYALSIRPILRWQDGLFFFLSTKMLPASAAIAAVYVLATQLHLLDTVWVLILLYTTMNLPIAIWMLRSFLLEIPTEVIEAARVDGAGFLRILWSVIRPIITPGMGACALICFIFAWNEFFFAVNLTSTRAATMPIYLVGFITSEGAFWAQLSAAATLCALPVVLAGWIAQDKLVRGLSLGAVK